MTTSSEHGAGRADGLLDEEDRRILECLRSTHATLDPVPPELPSRVGFALTVAGLEAEVAELTRLDAATASVRGGEEQAVCTITFSSGAFSALVTVEHPDRDAARVDGWVTGGAVLVELHHATSVVTTTTDEHGRFRFDGVERGLVHFVLRVTDPGCPAVVTPTVEI